MTAAQERLGKRIVAALLAMEFAAQLVDGRRVAARVEEHDIGGACVRIAHPTVRTARGDQWLVGLVTLEEKTPRITYAVPAYRAGIEAALRRVSR